MPLVRKPRGGRLKGHHSEDDESTPICRCRVLYLGSAVPHITKDGLQGIQEPLKELYPDTGLSSLKGIDSWLSVWSNGLLLENVDEKNTKITRFFPIESLHYCAAVRNVLVPAGSDSNGLSNSSSGGGGGGSEKIQKFLPLDSPFARLPNLNHPPLFACILRRTTGIKVLECHAFICKREMAANALVRCCFHAYADSTYAKQLENGGGGGGTLAINGGGGPSNGGGGGIPNGGGGSTNGTLFKDPDRQIQRSVTPLNSIEKVTGWQALSQTNGDGGTRGGGGDIMANSTDDDDNGGPITSTPRGGPRNNNKYEFSAEFDDDEIYEGDENHKIWGGSTASGLMHNGTSTSELVYLEPDGTLKSVKSHNSRLSKPRQFISPPPPPPPPPPQQFSLLKTTLDDDAASSSTNKKKIKKKTKKEMKLAASLQQQHNYQQQMMSHNKYLMRPASMMNLSSSGGPGGVGMSPRPSGGSVMNGPTSSSAQHHHLLHNRPGSAMSTLTRTPRPYNMHPHPHLIPIPHMNGYHHHQNGGYGPPMMGPLPPHHQIMHHPGQPIYGHLSPPLFNPGHHQVVKGSKSKGKKQQQQQILTQVPLLVPPPHPHHMHHGGPMMNGGPTPPPMYHAGSKMMLLDHHQQHDHHSSTMGGKGGSKHHHQQQQHSPDNNNMGTMTPSQYATIERGYHYHQNANRLMNGGGGGGSVMLLRNGDSATLTSTKSRGGKQNHQSGDEANGGPSSPFNTGIYRKKGHLNERAFSYSIRQEHRSRSYGSLANLQFANGDAGGGGQQLVRPSGSPPTAEGMKKEREIIQMVRDLDLSGDEIERSHVPAEMYPSREGGGKSSGNNKGSGGGGGGGGMNGGGYNNGNGHPHHRGHGHHQQRDPVMSNGMMGSHGLRITHR